MPLFGAGKKKDAGPQAGPPTDVVLQMRQQGLPGGQIVQNLQRIGYSTTDIFDAMNQADIKGGIEAAPISGFDPTQVENPMTYGAGQMTPQQGMPPMQPMPMTGGPLPPPDFSGMNMSSGPMQQMGPMPMQMQQPGMSKEDIEELVEEIIDEKWTEIANNINKIIEWKTKVETRIALMEDQMKDIQKQFDELRQSVMSKVGEYDQHIINVGTDVKAMEQVFQRTLPLFAENVRELGRITDSMKDSSQKVAKKY